MRPWCLAFLVIACGSIPDKGLEFAPSIAGTWNHHESRETIQLTEEGTFTVTKEVDFGETVTFKGLYQTSMDRIHFVFLEYYEGSIPILWWEPVENEFPYKLINDQLHIGPAIYERGTA